MQRWFIFAAGVAVHAAEPREFRARQLRKLPHEGAPFTQGLELFDDDTLIETSGSYPPGTASFIRLVDLHTGRAKRSDSSGLTNHFAEGVAKVEDGWMVITYDTYKALKFAPDLQLLEKKDYPWEGWGFAHAGDKFFATDGTEKMMRLSSESLALEEAKPVTCMGAKVAGMNELEYVEDFADLGPVLFGNLYRSRWVLGIDPKTYECTCFFSLDGLGDQLGQEKLGFHVANGIAYMPKSKTFMVTGKNWEEMFEIALEEQPRERSSAGGAALRHWIQSQEQVSLLEMPRSQLPRSPRLLRNPRTSRLDVDEGR